MIPNLYRWYPDRDNASIYYDLQSASLRSIFPSNTAVFAQGGVSIHEIGKTDRHPDRGNKELRSKTLTIKLLPTATTWHTKLAEINTYFKPKSKTIGRLIIKDTSDSDRQWYVDADVESQPRAEPGTDGVQIGLRVYDPDWKVVTPSTATWNIAGDTSTKDLTTIGNCPAFPIFDIKVTSPKTTGSQRKIYRIWRNPGANGASNEMLDVVNNAWDTAALINDTTKSNQVNHVGGYLSTDLSITVDTPVGGGLTTSGGMCYCARTGEQIRYTSITAGNMIVPSGGRGWGGSTAAALLDNDILSFSHLAKDGRDIRVRDNGTTVSRWLDGLNTTTSNVFVTLDYDIALQLNLRTAIAGVGDVATIEFSLDQLWFLNKLAAKENKVLGMGTDPNMEIFTYEEVDLQNLQVTGVKRAVFGSSKAAHALGDTVYWIQHVFEIAYGNHSLTAPTQDESRKPMQSLPDSTNTRWKWNEFFDKTGLRSGSWSIETLRGFTSHVYSKTQDDYADPAEEIGFAAIQTDLGGGLKPDSYEMAMKCYSIAGFSNIQAANGKRRRNKTDYPATVEMRRSLDGVHWTNIFTITSPSTAATWDTWTQGATAIASAWPFLDIHMKGSIKAIDGNAHYLEISSLTVDRSSGEVAQLAYASTEQTSAYELDATFGNSDSALSFRARGMFDYNETLRIDTENHRTTYLRDGVPMNDVVDYEARGEILPLDPEIVSDKINTFTFSDTGTIGLEITMTWIDRIAG